MLLLQSLGGLELHSIQPPRWAGITTKRSYLLASPVFALCLPLARCGHFLVCTWGAKKQLPASAIVFLRCRPPNELFFVFCREPSLSLSLSLCTVQFLWWVPRLFFNLCRVCYFERTNDRTNEQVMPYYLDLQQPDFTSHLALVHSRFSTNTFPSW